MAAGIAVKAVTVGFEMYGLGNNLRTLWASENRNRVWDLSDTDGGQQPRLNHFIDYLTPFCKEMAEKMGCRNTQITLDARYPTADNAEWVAYSRGIDFFIGRPLVVVNREMLPNSRVLSKTDSNFEPTHDALRQHHICQFYIAREVAHLKLNTDLKCTVLRIVVFVGTVFFLSPVLPIASYAIALVVERFISGKVAAYYTKWATQLAIQHSPHEAQGAALVRLDSIKRALASKVSECERKLDVAKKNSSFTDVFRCGMALKSAEREKTTFEEAHANLASLMIEANRHNPQT